MTLPFQDTTKRQYQCFVCGQVFDKFDLFKDHIVEEHERGRDYVVCPLQRCQSPVRDLSLHFKSRHKGEPMPKVELVRATIWHDFTPKGKKTRKPKFKQGWYTSQKTGQPIKYRSGWELEVYKLLDEWKEVYSYHGDDAIQIPYIFQGEKHDYLPDLIINFTSDRFEMWEVKPANQMTLEINQAKWAAAKAYCSARGWKFEVMNEQRINQLKKKIILENNLGT